MYSYIISKCSSSFIEIIHNILLKAMWPYKISVTHACVSGTTIWLKTEKPYAIDECTSYIVEYIFMI